MEILENVYSILVKRFMSCCQCLVTPFILHLGPHLTEKKLNDLNYVTVTPDRRKETQLCHIHMLGLM